MFSGYPYIEVVYICCKSSSLYGCMYLFQVLKVHSIYLFQLEDDILTDHTNQFQLIIKSLTPRSDRYINSPYVFNTVSRREVTRMNDIIN